MLNRFVYLQKLFLNMLKIHAASDSLTPESCHHDFLIIVQLMYRLDILLVQNINTYIVQLFNILTVG